MKFRGTWSAFVIITGILISATSLPIGAATRCVNPGGTGGCSSSIQRAINAAAPGDTILIGNGIYTENVVVTKPLTLLTHFLGTWQTPWWEDGVDQGPKTRAGFVATARLNRKEFGVNWNAILDRGGVAVGDDVEITLDAEAILDQ